MNPFLIIFFLFAFNCTWYKVCMFVLNSLVVHHSSSSKLRKLQRCGKLHVHVHPPTPQPQSLSSSETAAKRTHCFLRHWLNYHPSPLLKPPSPGPALFLLQRRRTTTGTPTHGPRSIGRVPQWLTNLATDQRHFYHI